MTSPMTEPAVSIRNLSVRFGSNTVLNGVDLDLYPGEVTALLGANGAGKSTLIKALSGINTNYGGDIAIDGVTARVTNPIRAQELGISTVHQKVADGIVPSLNVYENLVLDSYARARERPFRSKAEEKSRARAALAQLGLRWSDRELEARAGSLPISLAQLVVLARALLTKPRLLILDEPTSALDQAEVDGLFDVLRALRRNGLTILYVSHRFNELDAIADRVVILRDGAIHADRRPPFPWPKLVSVMLDRPALDAHAGAGAVGADAPHPRVAGAPMAAAQDVRLLPYSPAVSFRFHRGQVLGVLGLIGAGKSELCELFFGIRPVGDGSLSLDDKPYAPRSPADAIRQGVMLVPEDRQTQSIIPNWPLSRIISLPFLTRFSRWRAIPSRRREQLVAERVIDDVGVVTTGPSAAIEDLSGGNQQKVIVGRWLHSRPRLFLLDEPFRGVDIGARHDIGERLKKLAESGSAVVVLSSDIDEIIDVADRIMVLSLGRVMLDDSAERLTRDDLTEALSG